jgi:uncharacterized protein involved in exopolysaccharide biosynthesis
MNDDTIDLKILVRHILSDKRFILIFSTIFSIILTLFYSILPNYYESVTAVVSAQNSDELKLPSQIGGLASLAGINLNSGGADKSIHAIEILKSRNFAKKFIEDNKLYPELWSGNEESYEEYKLYKSESIKNKIYSDDLIFFESKSVDKFLSRISVNKEKTTGVISISFKHSDKIKASTILANLITTINETIRSSDISKSEKMVAYLNEKLASVSVGEIRQVFYSLIEEQTKTIMLASANQDYVFKSIDPPTIPITRSNINIVLFFLVAFSISIIISCFIILLKKYWRSDL